MTIGSNGSAHGKKPSGFSIGVGDQTVRSDSKARRIDTEVEEMNQSHESINILFFIDISGTTYSLQSWGF